MVAHKKVRLAVMGLRGKSPIQGFIRVAALPVVCLTVLAACTAIPPGDAGLRAADPGAAVPATRYRDVTGGYQSRTPVEPESWRERNQRIAPQDKP